MKCPVEHCRSEDIVLIRRVYNDGQKFAVYYCNAHRGKFAVKVADNGIEEGK